MRASFAAAFQVPQAKMLPGTFRSCVTWSMVPEDKAPDRVTRDLRPYDISRTTHRTCSSSVTWLACGGPHFCSTRSESVDWAARPGRRSPGCRRRSQGPPHICRYGWSGRRCGATRCW
jgi:hypothetical protein